MNESGAAASDAHPKPLSLKSTIRQHDGRLAGARQAIIGQRVASNGHPSAHERVDGLTTAGSPASRMMAAARRT